MKILGIDPGLNGGLTLLEDDIIKEMIVMPTIKNKNKKQYDIPTIISFIVNSCPNKVIIEKQHAMPHQGVSSMFTTGFGFGLLIGIINTLHIDITIISAQKWQKYIFEMTGVKSKDTKECSKQSCTKLYPYNDFRASLKCKNMHDGLTDSACIATYLYYNS